MMKQKVFAALLDSMSRIQRIVQPVLDRAASCRDSLDLQHAQIGVQVAAGPDFDPMPAAVDGGPIDVQLWGIEVHRLVSALPGVVDFQHAQLRFKGSDQSHHRRGR
jgi:hypothetical protein